ncbi:MAG: outer membrane lipoprotein carrier protein LolA [Bacteroidales bacterium]|nr:outer membrane lipoprotein carrier protein LolA [Bacteroidales bacterium]
MKRITLIIIALVASISCFAQSNDEIMAKLTQAAASMKSMQCNFTQNKTMSMLAEPTVSKGRMCYVSPDKMKWEYTDPYPFAIKVNGDKMTKVADGKEEILDTKNRMYQGMMKIIMSSATGKNLFDKSTFDVTISSDGNFWRADMKPKKSDMKRMFSTMTFYFEKKRDIINKVVLTEANGDNTTIQFTDIILNANTETCK